jgi:hypothetical protein
MSLSVGYRLPLLERRLGLELKAGVFTADARVTVEGVSSRAMAWVVPLSLLAAWQQPVANFVLRGAVGPSVQLAVVSANGAGGVYLLPGFQLAASLGRLVGPGRVELELGFSYARLDASFARVDSGGVALRLGYAVDFGPR